MIACPPTDQLQLLLRGSLADDRSSEIREHIESCHACQDALTLLSHPPDAQQTIAPESDGEQWLQFSSPLASDLRREAEDRGDMSETRVATEVDQVPHSVDPVPEIPGYDVVGFLGRGGMGAVYDAIHQRLGRPVAIKVLPVSSHGKSEVSARFEREMAAIGQLDHPNIVQAYHAAEHGRIHYLVMEKVDGQTVSQVARRNGCLSIADACEIIRQAAIGLQHAFENGLVHRDVKPSNMMISRDGTVKVLDLGLARLTQADEESDRDDDSQGELTSTGQIMGTLDYMAPEQAAGKNDIGITADIYSLGATLYRCLAGRIPFAGEDYQTVLQKLNALAVESPPQLSSLRSDVPPELESIVQRMMAKLPEQRYAQPIDAANALKPFCEGHDLAKLCDATSEATVKHQMRTGSTALHPGTGSIEAEVQPSRQAPKMIGLLGLAALGVLIIYFAVIRGGKQTVANVDDEAARIIGSASPTDSGDPSAGKSSDVHSTAADRHLQLVSFIEHPSLESTTHVDVSPDGRHVYTTAMKASALSVFKRDEATGVCEFVQTLEDPEFYGAIALELDGAGANVAAVSLYAKTLVVLRRDAETGKLTQTMLQESDPEGPAFGFPKGVHFSPDSQLLFVVDALYHGEGDQGAVVSFKMGDDGTPTFVEANTGLESCFHFGRQIAFHPTHNMMYVTSTSAETLTRVRWDRETGETKVEQVLREGQDGVEGLSGTFSVCVSDDGRFVYVSSGRFGGNSAVSVFAVGGDDSLSVTQELIAPRDTIRHFDAPGAIVISPDQQNVYVSCHGSSSVVTFSRDPESGHLTFLDSFLFDDGDSQPAGLSISPDGRFIYVALEGRSSLAVLRRNTVRR